VTTAPNPATIDAVRGTLERPLTPEEEAAVPNWLNRAWTILQGKVPGIVGRMALESDQPLALDEDLVVDVLAAMVERKVRNPDGLRSFTVDDVVHTVDAALSSGQIYPTPDELASLAIPAPAGGLYSIPLGR
jgi:hypothetical protein